jgi:hypothetical protein
VKPDINRVEVHPQLSHNRHPVDGALVGAGSLWPIFCVLPLVAKFQKKKKEKLNITRFYTKFQIDSQKYRRMHKLFKTFDFCYSQI